ncbi:MFS general substrate transporter [Coniophora puteana RWD-64-598 SS2]|uniref:MFS general substrate transporter n=1 Tax=Coniophora puteana (strain RWD-64-598) TaxID=741705 RepID=A0A5M3MNM8_CONPW|nr:MFS general substrate transporter [Coniophora puteana RWD-64-598 SS2]EIW80769.1 MFS general substrate transporter [Coniophora puteana RWD-64-598 SS2]
MQLLAPNVRPSAERKLVRKLDLRLMPTIFIIFLLNYIDRVAVTSARLQGLEQDLGLSDVQYDTVVAILYASYVPAQIPSNMVTHSFTGILICRVFIGLPEAAFYPGSTYLLSRWYTRKELAFRAAVLYVGLLVSNAFGSLIAAGILANMQGTLGIAAWRWLFYIEGAITMFIGFQALWLLPDYVRLAEDAGEADQDEENASFFQGFILAIKDPKVPIFMFMTCSQLLGLSFVNFFPTPPWIFTAIVTLINAWNCDRTGERFFHQTAWWWVVMVGYIISLSTMTTGGRYFSLFLMTSGYAGFTLTLVWVSNAIPRPPAKRSAAMGLVNGFGNMGNLIGSYIWKSIWGPEYHQSMIIAICSLALASVLSFVIRCLLIRDNRRIERAEEEFMHGPERERIEEAAKLEGISFEEAIRRRKGFRYLY